MTAIVRTRRHDARPLARAGLALPGLGHLLVGDFIIGGGLLSLDALLFLSAAGFGRFGDLLFDDAGQLMWHPIVAAGSWALLAVALWWTALRRAWPRVLSDEEWNSNQQIFLRTLSRHRTGMMGLFGVLFMVMLTLLTPLLAPYDPIAVGAGEPLLSPRPGYWMGTDEFGRDVLSRLLYGGRISLSIGFVAVSISATLGTGLGAMAAYFGGYADRTIMFVTDTMLAVPRLLLLLTIVGLFRVTGPSGIFLLVAILGGTAWMGIARIIRSEVLSLKQREFVQAARALGLSSSRILLVHIIPNALAPVIVYCSLAIGATMLTEATLSFLGLGVPPPTSTWGVMVNEGREPLRHAAWISLFPGFAIMIAVLSFNLLGDGLRDAMDPKLRG